MERSGIAVRVQRLVYARHGHGFKGWKSPVGVPVMSEWTEITTSRRQGLFREGRSEGSLSAKVRADEQKPHRRLSLRASQHHMTKPAGYRRQGKSGSPALKVHVLIRGDLSSMRCVLCLHKRPVRHLVDQGAWAPGEVADRSERRGQHAAKRYSAGGSNLFRDRAEVSRCHNRRGDHG
jgi:hypothetical protein